MKQERASNRYLRAACAIPPGQTRSFAELAAAAGRHGAARAAGRAIGAVPSDSSVPWQRVVAADGSLARDAERAAAQLRRLRREGARPRAGEGVRAWARRVGAQLVASLATRRFVDAKDERADGFDPLRVEALSDEAAASVRRCFHADAGAPPVASLPRPRAMPRIDPSVPSIGSRVAALDWSSLAHRLAEEGVARVPSFLRASECEALLAAGSDPSRFDRSVDMEPKGYGVGSYFYWKEPAPQPLRALRAELYRHLAPIASGFEPRELAFPKTLAGFWRECRAAGQLRPSSILLSYVAGGRNHPHRDLYGERWFPLQALVVLSRRGRDFEGGEFALWREETSGELDARELAVDRGELVLFASNRLPRSGARAARPVLHGVLPVTRGERFALGIAFHLAR